MTAGIPVSHYIRIECREVWYHLLQFLRMLAEITDDGHGVRTCLMGNADGSILQERYLQVIYSFRQRVWKLGCLHWRTQVDDALDIVPLAEFGAFGWCEYAEFATTQKQPLGNNIIYFTKVS